MKQYLLSILLCCLVAFSAAAQQKKAAPKAKSFTVVIDAGHGGKDPGAVGKITNEKTLNLDVCTRLAQLIQMNYPDVKVVLTRKTDVFLTLQERANIVNRNKADLFICIHTNSAESRSAVGTETFVLGVDKMQSNLDVAMRENAVMLLEDDYQTNYEGFDPSSIDSYIMFELMQDQYFDQSLNYATFVQKEFTSIGRSDRGVRQAGFWVLHKSACPSVLVEMGFISNAAEERYLASDQGKQAITASIYNAFVSYKAAVDKRRGIEPQKVAKVDPKADATKQEAKPETKAETKPDPKAEASKPEAKAETNAASPAEASTKEETAHLPEYRVQIFTTTQKLPAGDPTFRGLKNCQYTRAGKFYKYTYGSDTDYDTIVDIQQELRHKFKDCFVVAFLDGKPISVKEARALSQKK